MIMVLYLHCQLVVVVEFELTPCTIDYNLRFPEYTLSVVCTIPLPDVSIQNDFD